jgi:AraC-like DNA-binding protein
VNGRSQRVHVSEELEIVLAFTPLCIVDGAGRLVRLEAGSVGIVNPGAPHALRTPGQEPLSAGVLRIGKETMSRASEEANARTNGTAPWFPPGVLADTGLAAELHRIFEELRRPMTISGCESRLCSGLVQLIRRHSVMPPELPASPRHRYAARRVRDHLRANVADPVSIDDLARLAGLSKYYLVRVFTREYGLTPHAYQSELRLARARTLLSRGVSPSFAAFEAGFADQSHLTRRMRATLGTTPAAYARQFDGRAAGSRPAWARTRPRAANAA